MNTRLIYSRSTFIVCQKTKSFSTPLLKEAVILVLDRILPVREKDTVLTEEVFEEVPL